MDLIDFNSLNGPQRSALRAALSSAYSRADLEKLLSDKLDKSWENLVGEGKNKDDQLFDLIEASQEQGWTDVLVEAAAADRPNNAQIKRLDVTLRLMAPTLPPKELASRANLSLERAIASSTIRYFSDLVAFQGRICRVEADNFRGTGFLIASNLVLTNYHVVEAVKSSDGAAVICRFDWSPQSAQQGRSVKVSSTDWLPAYSPYAPGDDKLGALAPTEKELDFAVLRLDSPVGDELIDGKPRGWFKINDARRPSKNDAVLIVQYPLDRPLSMSMGAVVDDDRDGLAFRIHYAASTHEGSSGSPVFSSELELVALHHAGDPDADRPAEFNQGIPIGLIFRWLKKNKGDLFGQVHPDSLNSSEPASSTANSKVSQVEPGASASRLQKGESHSSEAAGAVQTTPTSPDNQAISVEASARDGTSGVPGSSSIPHADHSRWMFLSTFVMPVIIVLSSLALRQLGQMWTIPETAVAMILAVPGLIGAIVLINFLVQLWGDPPSI